MKSLEDIVPGLAIAGLFAGLIWMFIVGLQEQAAMTPEQIEKQTIQNMCISKVRGSRPSCWTETDWKIYCQRVQCKPYDISHE